MVSPDAVKVDRFTRAPWPVWSTVGNLWQKRCSTVHRVWISRPGSGLFGALVPGQPVPSDPPVRRGHALVAGDQRHRVGGVVGPDPEERAQVVLVGPRQVVLDVA